MLCHPLGLQVDRPIQPDHQMTSSSRPPPTSNRKRKRSSRKQEGSQNENGSHVVSVIINPALSDHVNETASHSPSASTSSSTNSHFDHQISPPDSYYLFQASKTQLLRLRRSQLQELIKSTRLNQRPDEDRIEHRTKEALVGLIIDSRMARPNDPLLDSNLNAASCLASLSTVPNVNSLQDKTNRPGHHQSLSQNSPRIRRLTRTKSLPSNLDLTAQPTSPRHHLTRQASHRKPQIPTRSRSRQRSTAHSSNDPLVRRTRSKTLAEEDHKGQLSSPSSWDSAACATDRNLAPRTTNHHSRPFRKRLASNHPRKVVKFTKNGLKPRPSDHSTPIARRTRHSSNQQQSAKNPPPCSSRGRGDTSRRHTEGSEPDTTGNESLLRSAKKLRNGKVIRVKRAGKEQVGRLRFTHKANGRLHDVEGTDDDAADSDDENDQDDVNNDEDEDEGEENLEEGDEEWEIELPENDEVQDDESDMGDAEDESDALDEREQSDTECQSRSDIVDNISRDGDHDSGASSGEEETGFVNLNQVTSKGLLRLKRDNLVRLCEERELNVEGTKKDLVQNLLEWRETVEDDDMSFSSQASQQSGSAEEDSGADTSAPADSTEQHTKIREGTYSRPIVLDSQYQTSEAREAKGGAPLKPLLLQSGHETHIEDSILQTPTGESPKSSRAPSKKDDIGELLDLESLNLQDKEIHADQIKKLDLIGSGGFKDVYKGLYRKVSVAISEIRGHLTEMDLKELRILRDLRHENIVRFIGVSVPDDPLKNSVPIMIISEICPNGDLFDYIRNVPSPGFKKICGLMRDISKGLDYLHSRDPTIIHRDLKSSNVLITARGVAKLNDFGLARIKNSTRSMVKSLVGTVNWQAPELWVAHPRYNEKVDVYSAGLVLWEMLQWHQPVKRYPFEGQNEHGIYQDVGQRHLRPATAGMRRQWGDEILNLVEKLWAQSPNDRPTMKEVIKELDTVIAGIAKNPCGRK